MTHTSVLPYPTDMDQGISRRSLLAASSMAMPFSSLAQNGGETNSVPLPPFKADTEQQSGPKPLPQAPDERVGFAVVGLENLSVEQLLPAFASSRKAKVTALVTGSPDKGKLLAKRYGIPETSVYGYDEYRRIAGS